MVVAYALSALWGWPQYATRAINSHEHAAAVEHGDEVVAEHEGAEHEATGHEAAEHEAAEHEGAEHAATDHMLAEKPEAPPPLWAVLPFVTLLGAIAILPLVPAAEHWWESNLNRFYVAASLGLITLVYYFLIHAYSVELHFLGHGLVHPSESGASFNVAWTVFQNAIFGEYIPFIVLLFSLYTISGGIRIEGDLRAHPLTNAIFIGVGGVLASFIGTTGAAMLLIRPLLETNAERRHVRHTVVFFIFVVCNCGGCLLPIGDPPLFLGYLQGVPFLWTMNLILPWLVVNGSLIVVYFLWDHFFLYPTEKKTDISRDETQTRRLRFSGFKLNALLLLGVILSVALLDPSKALPGTTWHPWLYLREIVQLGLVGVSLWCGSAATREANNFNYGAIVEVAALFLGIFICMQPALQILDFNGPNLGIDSPTKFFWLTGSLSGVLDNAPTYLVFFRTAQTLPSDGFVTIARVAEPRLVAISLGAVFMGAMTYIGNGPNFMVKAVAEKSGVKMPGFFGYMMYSFGILLPILIVMSLIFF
ncbi:MAG: sodium:proton antiporter [Planctomycetales bacterium]|nr:sodium:proton antiporter [Planctomycetales bacterium]